MEQEKIYDIILIGAGPGGYVAAIRASQLGLSVAVIEKDRVGGTCLNRGCIPSKSFLRSAELYRNTLDGETYGVITDGVKLDFDRVKLRKDSIVDQLVKGIEFLFKKNQIDYYQGIGKLAGEDAGYKLINFYPNNENTEEQNLTERLVAKRIVLATGSRPRVLPGIKIDGKRIVTSDEAFTMADLPESIIIVGGGVIGTEWASLLHDFGVSVTIVEYLDRILPYEDEEISKELTRVMKKRKIKIMTGAGLVADSITLQPNQVTLSVQQKGKLVELAAERVMIAVGREAVVDGLGLEQTIVELERGVIKVNDFYQTTDPQIYAIGDCIGGLQLAHVASSEGLCAVEYIAGLSEHRVKNELVPKCTFTFPEVASIGLTEAESIEKGHKVNIGKFNFRGIGKALVYGENDGFIKIVVDQETELILGVHMIGPHVTDMITELGLAKLLGAKYSTLTEMIYPHPTLSEAIYEALLNIDNRQIHG